MINEIDKDVITGSAYMPHDSGDLPPQEELKRLVTRVKNRRLELLLRCNANSHHEV
jgi:hypothetical protein